MKISQPLDGGWGWVIVIASFFINLLTAGILSTIDYLITQDEQSSYTGRAPAGSQITSVVIPTLSIISFGLGPISSLLVNMFGCRVVMMTGSIIAASSLLLPRLVFLHIMLVVIGIAIGYGLIRVPVIVSVTTYFDKYRSIATGIAGAGSGIGSLVFPSIIPFISQSVDLHLTLVMVGFVLICAILSTLFRSLTAPTQIMPTSDIHLEEQNLESLQSKDEKPSVGLFEMLSLFKHPVFILFTVLNVAASIGFYLPYIFSSRLAESVGLPFEVSIYFSVLVVANSLGHIVSGIADISCINRLWLYNICLVICGAATIIFSTFIGSRDYDIYSIYLGVFGFTYGAQSGLTSAVLVDVLGLDKFTNAYGLLMLFQSLAVFLSMNHVLNTHMSGFIIAGVIIVINGVILFAVPSLKRYCSRSKN